MSDRTRTPHPAEATAWAGAEAWAAAFVGLALLIGTGVGELGSGRPFPALADSPSLAAPSPPVGASRPAPAALPQVPPAPAGMAMTIDLNRADAATLQTLPGIGPVLAARVIAHREAHGRFQQPSDLLDVPGIGPKRFAQLARMISVGEGP